MEGAAPAVMLCCGCVMRFRSGVLISVVLLVVPAALFAAGLSFQAVKREVVEQRLASFSRDNTQREAILKKMFTDLGCADHLTEEQVDRKSTRLNSSHPSISYAVFCLKKKKK